MKISTLLGLLSLQVIAVASLPVDIATEAALPDLALRANSNTATTGKNGNGNTAAAATGGKSGSGNTAAAATSGKSGNGNTAAAATGGKSGTGNTAAAATGGKSGTGNTAAAATGGKSGSGNTAGAAQQKAVVSAANAFANDVATVSASLNGLGTTTDTTQIKQLAQKGFAAESDEDSHRAVLNQAAGSAAKAANQKIVDNTPIVLNGLKSISQNPSMANVAKQLNTMEAARNKNILPSITQLSSSAFDATGVNQQAKNFQSTTGSQKIKQLQASTASTKNAN